VQLKEQDKLKIKKPAWTGDWLKLWIDEKTNVQPWWAGIIDSIMELWDLKEVQLKLLRDGKVLDSDKEIVTLTAEPDLAWPAADRGLLLMPDLVLKKATNPGQAVAMGLDDTYQSIMRTYQGMISMFTGRVSASKSTMGPIGIARLAYLLAGMDLASFVNFLAIISVSLAVVNFLPIPVLDGGHMVFLIYEKLRGKPASERVLIAAMYVGVAIILSLVIFVTYSDVKHIFFRS